MSEWNIPQEYLDRSAELKAKDAEIERLKAEWKIQNECIADQHDKIRAMKAVVDAAEHYRNHTREFIVFGQDLDEKLAAYKEST